LASAAIAFASLAAAPRPGDAAPVVGGGHPSHDAGPVGAVLPRDTPGAPADAEPGAPDPPRRVVAQSVPDLRRCAGPGPARAVAAGFFPVPGRQGDATSPARHRGVLDRDAVLRRQKG
jgi:hypothetical protein